MFLSTSMSLSRPSFAPSVSPATSVGSNGKGKIQSRPNIMFEVQQERIKKMFHKVDLPTSCYDTAWVAMVASPSSSKTPLFPQTLNWLLENQQSDGSWGLPHHHNLLIKDSLLSTLACVLALKQWNVGEQQTYKGLQYIESNIAATRDDKQYSPIGFDIIFSHLIESAQKLDLNLPLGGMHLESLMQKRELELKRGWEDNSEGWKAYLAYISEGLGKSQNWEMAMKYQRKNGSLFNSPATTASAFTHLNNTQCLDYLLSLFHKYDNTVPAVHPLDVHAQLHLVDCLEKLGIDRHFQHEIQSVLDEIYRLWQQEDDDIFLEPVTYAMAFRLLRLHGYDISSEEMNHFSEDKFCNTLQGYLKDVGAILELHKSSQIVLHSNDSVLEEQSFWTGKFLEEYLSSSSDNAHKPFHKIDHEIRYAVRFPYHTSLDRILNRTSIENYKVDEKRILKTSYSHLDLATSKNMLELAVQDFNHGLSMYQKDLQQFNKWFMESGLDKLHFAVSKTKLGYSFMTAAGGHSWSELNEARLAWAKNGLLVYVADDLYDVWGSQEEQIHLLGLMEKWDVDVSKEDVLRQ
ncbi:ent-kaur-16-ene synthase, chloroplastic-like [Prosopis cineraria]|uniref:ent-kaur-16-ene synthase, chloroplastic-like n=1 Tax=Prosopis cineraria TaxID=364024 RepID=UPI00240ED4CF|nr:ent-kaur-16-ene synthase, chloroplastic-like [Prosopis cineraria]